MSVFRPRPTLRRHDASWWLRAGQDPRLAAEVIEAAWKQLHAGAENVKYTRQKSVYFLDLQDKTRPTHVLKTFRYAGADRYARRVRGSKAYRELRISEELARRGIRTPEIIAAGEFYKGRQLDTCWLLVSFLDGARDLAQLPELLSAEPVPYLASALGSFCRDLYEAGLLQRDLAPNNILLDADGQLWITDFERAQLRARIGDRSRWRELARFERYLARARITDRAHFLRAFSRGEFLEARRHWVGVSREIRRMARRDAAHVLRVSSRDGRRYRGVAWGEWQGQVVYGLHASDFSARLGRGDPIDTPELDVDDEFFRIRYPKRFAKRARRHFATAILLARRRLSPDPVALWFRGDGAEIFFRRAGEEPMGQDPSVAAAKDRLLRKLCLVGRLDPGHRDEDFVVRSVNGRPRALLAAPHRVTI